MEAAEVVRSETKPEKRALEDEMTCLEKFVSRRRPTRAVAGPFAIGSFGPTLADAIAVPLLHAIDSLAASINSSEGIHVRPVS